MGTSIASVAAATMPIGMSRSSSASSCPAWRARLAASAERTPETTGPAMRSSVQIAATAITPAPKKRTSALNTLPAQSSTLAPGIGWLAVSIGSSTHQPTTRPSSIAMPTEIPTRWPTPSSANESPPEIPVAPAPVRNHTEASAAISLVCVRIAKAAEATVFQASTESPLALSAAPCSLAKPTRSTSAAAWPSG